MKIVGILAGAGAGKTTVADYLVEKYGAVKFSFATPLKELLTKAFDLPRESLYGTQEEKERVLFSYGLSGRQFMTRVGQAARETFGTDFWVRECLRRVAVDAEARSLADMGPNPNGYLAVIDDVRYVNEAQGVQWYDSRAVSGTPDSRFAEELGYVWRLESPWRQSKADAKHPSESEWMLAPYDHLIRCETKGLDELYRLVDEAAEKFGLVPVEGK